MSDSRMSFIESLLKARDCRLSCVFDFADFDDCSDDSVSILLDGESTGIYLQMGTNYVWAHREVEEPSWAMLHLYDDYEGDMTKAVNAAVDEALTNTRLVEWLGRVPKLCH